MNMAATGRGAAQAADILTASGARSCLSACLGPVSLRTVISAWAVMNTAISRATSSPAAAPRLTVQALRNRWRGPWSERAVLAFMERGPDSQFVFRLN